MKDFLLAGRAGGRGPSVTSVIQTFGYFPAIFEMGLHFFVETRWSPGGGKLCLEHGKDALRSWEHNAVRISVVRCLNDFIFTKGLTLTSWTPFLKLKSQIDSKFLIFDEILGRIFFKRF